MTRWLLLLACLLIAVACRPETQVIYVEVTPTPTTAPAPTPTPTMDAFCEEYLRGVREAIRKTGTDDFSPTTAISVLRGVPADLRERECLERLGED